MVTLEGRPIHTAGGHYLCLPTYRLAMAIALEFDSQISRIVWSQMPLLNIAITAIDRVRTEKQQFIDKFRPVIECDSLWSPHIAK